MRYLLERFNNCAIGVERLPSIARPLPALAHMDSQFGIGCSALVARRCGICRGEGRPRRRKGVTGEFGVEKEFAQNTPRSPFACAADVCDSE